MGIQLGSNFTVNAALPLDDRTAVADVTARDAIASGRKYAGLKVYVVADDKTYKWDGSTWTEDGGAPAPNTLITPVQIVGDYTILETDNVILVDATSGNIILTLPDPTLVKQIFYIKRVDNSLNTVTIVDASTGTIDGAVNLLLKKQWDAAIICPDDGFNWLLLSKAAAVDVPVTTKTANYSSSVDDEVILVDATSGNITITLPDPTLYKKILKIKKIDSSANTVTIAPNVAETVEGAANFIIYDQYISQSLVSDGTNWSIL